MRRGSKKALQAGIAFSVAALAAATAFAQSPNSPVSGRLTFATTADINTNRNLAATSPGSTFNLSERLGFSFQSETSTQVLTFNASAGLSFSSAPGGGSWSQNVTTPTASLRYRRDAANGNLTVDGRYWSGDVISSYDADPSPAVSIIVDTGTLTTVRTRFAGNIGTNAPLGLSLNASYNLRDYTGTTNPALFDETTTTLGVTGNLRLSPTTQGTVSVTQTNYISTDPFTTTFQQMDYAFGLTHDLDGATTIDANFGYRDKRTTASGATTLALGMFGGVNVTRALPNGSVFGGVQVDLSGATSQTILNFGRTIDMSDGTLTASLSADMPSGGSARLYGSASYNKQLSDGSFTVGLSQSIATNNFGQDIRYSNLGIAYDKTLNSVEGVNLSLNVSRSEDVGGGTAPTLGRASLSASYSRAITPEWDLSVGYTHQQSLRTGSASANSDSVFLTLTRDLQFSF